MREMNLSDAERTNNRNRVNFITTRTSSKLRPDDEIAILMRSARNRFLKSVAAGRIEIISKREWTLR